MSDIKNDTNISDLLAAHNPAFDSGFSSRVMAKIANIKDDTDIISIFRWIALSGVAAIILLMLTVYFTEGSFTADAIYGIIDFNEEESLLTAYNF